MGGFHAAVQAMSSAVRFVEAPPSLDMLNRELLANTPEEDDEPSVEEVGVVQKGPEKMPEFFDAKHRSHNGSSSPDIYELIVDLRKTLGKDIELMGSRILQSLQANSTGTSRFDVASIAPVMKSESSEDRFVPVAMAPERSSVILRRLRSRTTSSSSVTGDLETIEEDEDQKSDGAQSDANFLNRHPRIYMAGIELENNYADTPAHQEISLSKSLSTLADHYDAEKKKRAKGTHQRTSESNTPSRPLPKKRSGLNWNLPPKQFIRNFLEHWVFQVLTSFCILVSAVNLGIQTDIMAQEMEVQDSLASLLVDLALCVYFLVELILRLWVDGGKKFLTGEEFGWNIFDLVMLTMQALEVGLGLASLSGGESSSSASTLPPEKATFTAARLCRVIRFVRIIWILRFLRFMQQLRTIIVSILGTARTLLWTVLLLFMIIFIFSVVLTQIVTSFLMDNMDSPYKDQLSSYFSDVGSCCLMLFQAITNGLDWNQTLTPLMKAISPWLAVPFLVYITFGTLALSNVITGVFVESALESSQKEKRRFLLHTIRRMFAGIDEDRSGDITWEEFEAKLDHPDMQVYFKTIDVGIEEAQALFHLIDMDHSGSIDPEEFVNGCIRLHGPAKAIDLAALMSQFHRHVQSQKKRQTKVLHEIRDVKIRGSLPADDFEKMTLPDQA